jgi:hypothetical protein
MNFCDRIMLTLDAPQFNLCMQCQMTQSLLRRNRMHSDITQREVAKETSRQNLYLLDGNVILLSCLILETAVMRKETRTFNEAPSV